MTEFPSPSSNRSPSFGLDIGQAAGTLRQNAGTLVIFAVVGALVALLYLHISSPIYKDQMIVTTVQSSESNGSRLSGLASVAGLDIRGGNSQTQFQLYLESLTSHEVAEGIAADQAIMRQLFPDRWDPDSNTWKKPKIGAVGQAIRGVKSLLGWYIVPPHTPDADDVKRFLDTSLDVTTELRTPYIATVTLQTGSPELGRTLLTVLNKMTNDHLRQQAILRAHSYINYLTNQLQTVTQSDQRTAIVNALNEQEKYAMMANSDVAYAAEMLDRPYAPPTPSAPRPLTIYLKFMLLMVSLGAVWVLSKGMLIKHISLDESPGGIGRIVRAFPRLLRGAPTQ